LEKQRYHHFKAKDFVLDKDFRSWLSGTAPGNDLIWESWLAEDAEMAAEVEKAKMLFHALNFNRYDIEDEAVHEDWERLKSSITDNTAEHLPNRSVGKISWLWRVAAACVLLVSVFAVKQIWFSNTDLNKTELVTRTAPKGERLTIKLIDGTSVRLNSGSALTFPKIFPGGKRELTLVGEAYFEVAPDKNAPFIIHTGEVTTQVLGTTFGIEAYPETGDVRVAVVEGKVKVKSESSSVNDKKVEVFLIKNEMATFDKAAKKLAVSEFDSKKQLAWKDGVLYFDKTNFDSVIKKLENWYGVKIQVGENVKLDPEWRFSGKFDNQSLDYILNVVRYPNQFSFEINKNFVTIK
jgi:transmembrane sensor